MGDAGIDFNEINFNDEKSVQSVLLQLDEYINNEKKQLEICASKYIESLNGLENLLASKVTEELFDTVKKKLNVLGPVKDIFDNKLKKLEEFHVGKENLERVIKQVDDILDINLCAETVKRHILSKNYELAAALVNRYLKLDPRVLADMLNKEEGARVNDLEKSFHYLNQIKLHLQDVFRERYKALVKGEKSEDEMLVFQMFPLVDLKAEGLKLFVSYFKEQFISQGFTKGLDLNTTMDGFKRMVGQMLQYYASKGKIALNFLNLYYDTPDFVYFLREVHESCLSREFLLIDNYFKSVMDVEKICVLIRKYDPSKSLSLVYKGVPISEAQNHLDYMSVVFSYYSVYTNFLADQLKNGAILFSSEITSSNKTKMETLVSSMIHNDRIKDILERLECFYSEINNFLVSVSCFKALGIDTSEDDCDTPRLPDDIFYILSNNLKKCASTCNKHIIESMLLFAKGFLDNNMTVHLRRRLMEAPGMTLYYEMSTLVHDKVELKKTGYMIQYLRDLSMLYVSLEKLKVFVTYIKNVYENGRYLLPDSRNNMIAAQFEKIADSWENLKEEKISFLNNESLVKLLMETIDTFLHKNKLIITEEELIQQTCNRDFGSDILARVGMIMDTIEKNLNRTVFEEITENLSHIFVSKLCEKVSKYQCNQFGTMLIDKLLRMISVRTSSYFNNTVFTGFRDGFLFFEIMGLSLKTFTSDDSLMILRCNMDPYDIVAMIANRVDVPPAVKSQIRKALL